MTTATLPLSAYAGRNGGRMHGPVLVAIATEGGSAALRAGRRVAAHLGLPVRALSVLEPQPIYLMAPELGPLPPQFEIERLEARLEDLRSQVEEALGPDADLPIETRGGDTASAVAHAARERGASLLVVGTGHHDVLSRVLAGETAIRIVRRADRPVLVVATELPSPLRTAVAALDFSAASIAAARTALALLDEGGTLHLVHAWQPAALERPSWRARDEAYERGLAERFAQLERDLHPPRGVTVRSAALAGSPVETVLAFARACGADLVAAGRHGQGLLERLLVGSVSTGLIRGADCAVLVAPEPAASAAGALARQVAGTVESRRPGEWRAMMERFAGRNHARRTRLEVDDPAIGAQAQQAGFALLGATFDEHGARLELMLGDPGSRTRHLTRDITGVTSVGVATDADGRDVALRVEHGSGQTLLTFLPDDPDA